MPIDYNQLFLDSGTGVKKSCNVIVEKLGISEDFIKHKLGHQEKDSDRWIILYEFEPK